MGLPLTIDRLRPKVELDVTGEIIKINLRTLDLAMIGDIFNPIDTLEVLLLGKNRIISVGKLPQTLKRLGLSNNLLTFIPKTVLDLPFLEVLNLDNNPLLKIPLILLSSNI